MSKNEFPGYTTDKELVALIEALGQGKAIETAIIQFSSTGRPVGISGWYRETLRGWDTRGLVYRLRPVPRELWRCEAATTYAWFSTKEAAMRHCSESEGFKIVHYREVIE